ncbi:MAG: DUF309 domain-containing protein [Chloroflexota bacterium]
MTGIIVVAGNPAWEESLSLPEGFALKHYPDTSRYVYRLTDDRAAMVLVDGERDDWQFWTATPKSSAATRRIPVVIVTADAAVQSAALASGADIALAPDHLADHLSAIIRERARVPDPEREEQLDCECARSLPPLAVQGVEKFNNREFYPQHDLFEEQWVNTDGPVRDLYRAVLQVGVAYYQIERGNHRGALKMLLRAVQWLEALPDVCQTINVAQLKADAYAVRAELERMNPDDIAQFDMTLLKPVLLTG